MHQLRVNVASVLQLALQLFLMLGISASAYANDDDGFKLNAGFSQRHDSNLYRLSDRANVLARTGKSSAAETIGITNVGVAFNKSYSLQRVELALDLVNYDYQNFSNLNSTARNFKAAWLWSITPHLHGVLSSKRTEQLNSYADFTNFNQSNLRTNEDTVFNAEYELGARWRLLGGASHTTQTNQQVILAESDYAADNANIGVRYVLPSGNSLSYRLTNTDGSYLNRALSNVSFYDNGFHEANNEVRLNWVIGSKTNAVINAGHVRRTHSNFAQRDYSGINAGAAFNWNLTGKSRLSISWARQLASYQTATSNYSQVDRIVVSPSWQISAKTQLRGTYQFTQRDYLGRPFGGSSDFRKDTTHDTSISLDWQPHRSLTFTAALQNSRRGSNRAGLDFNSNMVTLSAQYSH